MGYFSPAFFLVMKSCRYLLRIGEKLIIDPPMYSDFLQFLHLEINVTFAPDGNAGSISTRQEGEKEMGFKLVCS